MHPLTTARTEKRAWDLPRALLLVEEIAKRLQLSLLRYAEASRPPRRMVYPLVSPSIFSSGLRAGRILPLKKEPFYENDHRSTGYADAMPPLRGAPWRESAGSPARQTGEWCGVPPGAAPARRHIVKLLPRYRGLRRAQETGCSPWACRRRISCLAHAPPGAWARPDAARWRGAGRGHNSPDNQAARWRDHNHARPAGRARAAARCTSRRARCRAGPRPADPRGNSLRSSAPRAVRSRPHCLGLSAAHPDTMPSALGRGLGPLRCQTARPCPAGRSGGPSRRCRTPTTTEGAVVALALAEPHGAESGS